MNNWVVRYRYIINLIYAVLNRQKYFFSMIISHASVVRSNSRCSWHVTFMITSYMIFIMNGEKKKKKTERKNENRMNFCVIFGRSPIDIDSLPWVDLLQMFWKKIPWMNGEILIAGFMPSHVTCLHIYVHNPEFPAPISRHEPFMSSYCSLPHYITQLRPALSTPRPTVPNNPIWWMGSY